MIAVIFEVIPETDCKGEYLDMAAQLRPELEKVDGFISIERFQSLSDPSRLLSLSFWRDEDSIKQWRTMKLHRAAQVRGRTTVFKDYRLRIADVMRDYGMSDRSQAPTNSKMIHH